MEQKNDGDFHLFPNCQRGSQNIVIYLKNEWGGIFFAPAQAAAKTRPKTSLRIRLIMLLLVQKRVAAVLVLCTNELRPREQKHA